MSDSSQTLFATAATSSGSGISPSVKVATILGDGLICVTGSLKRWYRWKARVM